ncbi:MAG: 3-deoxy-7-phosphoheptulonate synthase [Kiritimatiellae bacterium]|nr:3-deoxy-7-phosphoheptulonate synthase [Kiritimatiellia bacterium]
MIISLKQDAGQKQIDSLVEWLKARKITPHISAGEQETLIGCVGDVAKMDVGLVQALSVVESVQRIQEPYKAANRKFQPDDTVVDCSGVKIGGGELQVIAGPCSVESVEQMVEVAKSVKAAGATLMRGGAFKPRTSPYAFQGLGKRGLEILLEAKKETGLPIVTELMSIEHLPLFNDVDVIQIGARNMQNFDLLKEVGSMTKKPILLKRGMSATLQELLMSAEYIMASGNPNVMLCERGIRTFETATRNTIDLTVIPVLKRLSHLPVVIDPSHATGYAHLVEPCAMGATAMGADALIVEVHNNPSKALCDGAQSQTPEAFGEMMKKLNALKPHAWKRG